MTLNTLFASTSRLVVAYAFVCAGAHAAAVFVPNDQPTGWVAEVDVTNFNFARDADTTLFKPDFDKSTWAGNLYAFPVDKFGTVSFAAERWSGGAAEQLKGQHWLTGRRIVTLKKNAIGTAGTPIGFQWDLLDSWQKKAMGDDERILNFIRGDPSNENPLGQKYRKRTSVLGDIIHSRPCSSRTRPIRASTSAPTTACSMRSMHAPARRSSPTSPRC